MKKMILTSTPVYGMALINPQLQQNTTIEVEIYQKDEGQIPHIHVWTDKTNTKCAIVRLDAAEYSHHHDSNHPENCRLNSKQINELINILQTPWRKRNLELADGSYRIATGYEAAVDMWIEAFGEPSTEFAFTYDEDGAPIMPNYLTLNKDKEN